MACGSCGKKNNDIDSFGMIRCNCCSKWYHSKCCSINSKEEFDTLSDVKKLWFCPVCLQKSNFKYAASQIFKGTTDTGCSSSLGDESLILKLIDERMEKIWPMLAVQVFDKVMLDVKPLITSLETRILNLESTLSIQENHYRAKNLIIQGIPDSYEIFNGKFLETLAGVLDHNNFSLDQIDYITKIKRRRTTNKTLPSVLVRFSTLRGKSDFMSYYLKYIKEKRLSIKCFNEDFPDGMLYINEHLPKKLFTIFMKARSLVKQNSIWKASIRKGVVYIQVLRMDSPRIIRTMEDLTKYSKELKCSTPVEKTPEESSFASASSSLDSSKLLNLTITNTDSNNM